MLSGRQRANEKIFARRFLLAEKTRDTLDMRRNGETRLAGIINTALCAVSPLFRGAGMSDKKPVTAYGDAIENYAALAFQRCCAWFGTPADAAWPYEILPWHKSFCSRALWFHRYFIAIAETDSLEECCKIVGHEMYHRVVSAQRKTPILKHNLWVDELLAELTAYRLLDENGMGQYVEKIRHRTLSETKPLAMQRFRETRIPLRYRFGWSKTNGYPLDFSYHLRCVSAALLRYIEWERICRLPQFPTVEAWLESLSPDRKYFAGRILRFEDDCRDTTLALAGLDAPAKNYFHRALGFALSDVKRFEEALTEMRMAAEFDSQDAELLFRIGLALRAANRLTEGLPYMERASEIGYSKADVQYTFGCMLLEAKRCDEAIAQFQQIMENYPANYGTLYYLGEALYEAGRRNEAKEAWEVVLKYSDASLSPFAAKMLEKCA